MKNITDEYLVNELKAGNEIAFNQLYEKYRRMVFYVAVKTMHNEADAQDIMQETFLQIHKSIHNVTNPEYLQLWINRIVVNKCNKLYAKRKEVFLDDNDKNPIMSLQSDELMSSPKQYTRFSNDQEILCSFIDQLPPAQRIMIILMYFQQFSVEEIAKICDIPAGTVKSRCKAARDTLRKKIELYEKQQGVKLNFHEGLSAFLVASLCMEANKAHIPDITLSHMRLSYNASFFSALSFKATLLLTAGCTAIGVGAATIQHTIRQQELPKEQKASHMTPEQAYYSIMIWANTKELIEMKKDEIMNYQNEYQILKQEAGIYWNLFLKSELNSYFYEM